jgi:polyisoprenoid-binding protein YceI
LPTRRSNLVRSGLELTIEAGSRQIGNRKRDRHLRSADFFDAENHPEDADQMCDLR